MDLLISFSAKKHNSIKNPKFLAQPHQRTDQPLDKYYVKSCFIIPEIVSNAKTNEKPKKIVDLYKEALDKGFRHFEIDLMASKDDNSIRAGCKKQSSPTVELSRLLTVFNSADLSKGPLILTLNLHFDAPEHLITLSSSLISAFTTKLLDLKSSVIPTLGSLFNHILIRSSLAKALEIEKGATNIDDKFEFSKLISLDAVNLHAKKPSENGAEKLNGSASHSNTANQINNSSTSTNRENGSHENGEKKLDENYKNNEGSNDIEESENNDPFKTLIFDALKFANFSSLQEEKALMITSEYFTSVSPSTSYQLSHPTLFWNHGVQSVFIPYPQKDVHSELNEAFFEANGNCGFVLKSTSILGAANTDSLNPPMPKPRHHFEDDNLSAISMGSQMSSDNVWISLSVICARLISDINIKPFVYAELYGPTPMYGSTDVADSRKDTSKINPRFNNQFQIIIPKANYRNSVLQISLWDNNAIESGKGTQMLGRCSMHVSTMRQGFRVVNLEDEKGNSLDPTTILIHVKKSCSKNDSAMSLMVNSSQNELIDNTLKDT